MGNGNESELSEVEVKRGRRRGGGRWEMGDKKRREEMMR